MSAVGFTPEKECYTVFLANALSVECLSKELEKEKGWLRTTVAVLLVKGDVFTLWL
jgi:hypothetical protein